MMPTTMVAAGVDIDGGGGGEKTVKDEGLSRGFGWGTGCRHRDRAAVYVSWL